VQHSDFISVVTPTMLTSEAPPSTPSTSVTVREAEATQTHPVVVIEHRPGWAAVDAQELWRYRELLAFLVWRDVKVRYKQTVLGAAWAILQPLATMIVFSLFFSRVSQPVEGGPPYPLFVLAGLLPWFFFSNAVSSASQSIVSNQSLVTKIYFPRVMIPMGAVAAGLVDFGISLGLLLVMMAYYGVIPGLGLVMAPVLIALLVVASLGVGTLLSALTVAYRDVRHIVPFLVQLWMFATPAIYLSSAEPVGGRWAWLLPLNPAQGLIANFRAAVLGGSLDWYALGVSAAVSLTALVVGGMYFRRVERSFADII
jgi:lipopolysaccharide transport system permease protein